MRRGTGAWAVVAFALAASFASGGAAAAHTAWGGRADLEPASVVQGARVTVLLNVWNTGPDPIYVSEITLGTCWGGSRVVMWNAAQQGYHARVDPGAGGGFRHEVTVPQDAPRDCAMEARVIADEDEAAPWDVEDYALSLRVSPPFGLTFDTLSRGDLSVEFQARTDGGREPYRYAWDFGDGGTSAEGPTVTHRYASAGTYTVSLRVTDADGRAATTSHAVAVREAASPEDADSGGGTGDGGTTGGGDGGDADGGTDGGTQEGDQPMTGGGNDAPGPAALHVALLLAGVAVVTARARRRGGA